MLSPARSPIAFPLWPTTDASTPGQASSGLRVERRRVVARQAAARWRTASRLPNDPENFLPAGSGATPRSYDVVQDVITRDEWHSYQNIAFMPTVRILHSRRQQGL